jgi:hypothetical protein
MFLGNASKLDQAIKEHSEDIFKQALKKNLFLDDPSSNAGVQSLFNYMMQVRVSPTPSQKK